MNMLCVVFTLTAIQHFIDICMQDHSLLRNLQNFVIIHYHCQTEEWVLLQQELDK